MANLKVKPSVIVDSLMELAAYTDIVNHVPGRIQLKIRPAGLMLALNLNVKLNLNLSESDLQGPGKSLGILDIDAKKSSRVLTILYDEKKIPKELWELLIKAKSNPKLQQLVRKELIRRLPSE